jgi:hypothetical protein
MKPISINELTTGNLVYYKIPGKPKPVPIKITSILSKVQEKDAEYIEASDFDWIPFKATNIKPIPLTRKRLEKNGFKFDEEETESFRRWKNYPTEAYTMSIVFNGYNFFLFKNKKGYHIEDHILLKPIKYVHELQNVLKLMGKTELANNFKP